MRRIDEALQGVSAIARSGFALILGTLIASGLGMVFWALAARLLTPAQLGIGAALISAITTLSHASQLNLRNLLHRFVPEAGADASKLIHRSYGAAAVMALLLGAGFVAIAAATTPDLAFLGSSPLPALGFVAALLIWTLYALQEAALDPLMTGRELIRLQATLQGLPTAEGRRRADDLVGESRHRLAVAADARPHRSIGLAPPAESGRAEVPGIPLHNHVVEQPAVNLHGHAPVGMDKKTMRAILRVSRMGCNANRWRKFHCGFRRASPILGT